MNSPHFQRRNVELLLPTLAMLPKEVLDPIASRTGLRVRTDVRAPPPAWVRVARAFAAIAAIRDPGAFKLPSPGEFKLLTRAGGVPQVDF
jgi:hypothetical protein